MGDGGSSAWLDQQIRTLWIISAALLVGVLVFALFAFFLVGPGEITTDFNLLVIVGVVVGIGCYAVALVFPPFLAVPGAAKGLPRATPAGESKSDRLRRALAARYITRTIMRLAILEGGVFCNLVLFIVTKGGLSLGMGVLGMLIMLACLPFPGQMIRWMESQEVWHRDSAGH